MSLPRRPSQQQVDSAELSGAVLAGALLAGLDLRGRDLRGAVLRRADLRGCKLNGALLEDADLSDVDLDDADLSGASLVGCRLVRVRGQRVRFDDADLRGADLSAAVLPGASLTGCQLDRAEARSARLEGCLLEGASLRLFSAPGAALDRADLSRAVLDGAELSRVSMEFATADQASFEGARLGRARLDRASVAGARFDGAQAGGLRMPGVVLTPEQIRALQAGGGSVGPGLLRRLASRLWVWVGEGGPQRVAAVVAARVQALKPKPKPKPIAKPPPVPEPQPQPQPEPQPEPEPLRLEPGADLSTKDLRGFDLRGLDLSGANLDGARLDRADMVGTLLDGASLVRANLVGTMLRGASLRGANLSQARLDEAVLEETDLEGALLSGAILLGARLRGARLMGAVFADADLSVADLTGCSLNQVDLRGARLDQADLTGADLNGVVARPVDLAGALGLRPRDLAALTSRGEPGLLAVMGRRLAALSDSPLVRAAEQGLARVLTGAAEWVRSGGPTRLLSRLLAIVPRPPAWFTNGGPRRLARRLRQVAALPFVWLARGFNVAVEVALASAVIAALGAASVARALRQGPAAIGRVVRVFGRGLVQGASGLWRVLRAAGKGLRAAGAVALELRDQLIGAALGVGDQLDPGRSEAALPLEPVEPVLEPEAEPVAELVPEEGAATEQPEAVDLEPEPAWDPPTEPLGPELSEPEGPSIVLLVARVLSNFGERLVGRLRTSPRVVTQEDCVPGADLSGVDLRPFDLRWVDLAGANLKGALMQGMDLRGAFLEEVDLEGAQLQRAILDGAVLCRASMHTAHLDEASLQGADLRGIRAVETSLVGASLLGAQLSGAQLLRCDLGGADLRDLDLDGVDLTGCALDQADLSGSSLVGAVVEGADLGGALGLAGQQRELLLQGGAEAGSRFLARLASAWEAARFVQRFENLLRRLPGLRGGAARLLSWLFRLVPRPPAWFTNGGPRRLARRLGQLAALPFVWLGRTFSAASVVRAARQGPAAVGRVLAALGRVVVLGGKGLLEQLRTVGAAVRSLGGDLLQLRDQLIEAAVTVGDQLILTRQEKRAGLPPEVGQQEIENESDPTTEPFPESARSSLALRAGSLSRLAELLVGRLRERPRQITREDCVPGADLSGLDLRPLDLRGVDLSGANLRGVLMQGMDLSGALLEEADLRGAQLQGAILDGAVLCRASMRGARMDEARLLGADLRGVQAEEEVLVGASLFGSTLSGAQLGRSDLAGAHLDQADLAGASLVGAMVEGADLGGALGLAGQQREALLQQGASAGNRVFARLAAAWEGARPVQRLRTLASLSFVWLARGFSAAMEVVLTATVMAVLSAAIVLRAARQGPAAVGRVLAAIGRVAVLGGRGVLEVLRAVGTGLRALGGDLLQLRDRLIEAAVAVGDQLRPRRQLPPPAPEPVEVKEATTVQPDRVLVRPEAIQPDPVSVVELPPAQPESKPEELRTSAAFRAAEALSGLAEQLVGRLRERPRRVTLEDCVAGADLSGLDLRQLDLRGLDLAGANLQGALMQGMDLSGTVLEEADLGGAQLQRAILDGAVIRRASLRRARLDEASLRGADLRGLQAAEAVMVGVSFLGSQLGGARLVRCDLGGADLRGQDLREVDLAGAYLDQADLSGASLVGARVEGADLGGTLGLAGWQRDALLQRGAQAGSRLFARLASAWEVLRLVQRFEALVTRSLGVVAAWVREGGPTRILRAVTTPVQAVRLWFRRGGHLAVLALVLRLLLAPGRAVWAVLVGLARRRRLREDRRAEALQALARELRPGASLKGRDLRALDLAGVDLSQADLRRARLDGVDLTGTRLIGANLSGARLRRAVLRQTDLSGAWLDGARLDEAELRGVDLRGVEAERTRFSGARFERVQFDGASLAGADFSAAVLEGVDLRDADLSGARFSHARLAGARFDGALVAGASFVGARGLDQEQAEDLRERDALVEGLLRRMLRRDEIVPPVLEPGADLSGEDLRGVDLSGLDLSGAKLTGARLEGAVLRGTRLDGADLDGARFRAARLEGASLREASAHGASFDDAHLQGADLWKVVASHASLVGAELSRCSLREAVLVDADLAGAVLTDADLSGADLSRAVLDQAELAGTRLDQALVAGADLETAFGLDDARRQDLRQRGAMVGLKLPELQLPDLSLPELDLSGLKVPKPRLPKVSLPDLSALKRPSFPTLKLPSLKRPSFPTLKLPSLPTVKFPKPRLPTLPKLSDLRALFSEGGPAELPLDSLVPGANLAGRDLRFSELGGRDLSGADLRDARLEGLDLRGCILRDAKLVRARMDRAVLSGVDLRGADLEGASLEDALLDGADLSGARLVGAQLAGTSLDTAALENAVLDDVLGVEVPSVPSKPALLDLGQRAASLVAFVASAPAVPPEALVPGTDLRNADLRRVELKGLNLRGADLRGARLDGVDLSGTILAGARLDGARLSRAQLVETDLRNASAGAARFDDARLTGARLEGLKATRAVFRGASFLGAQLDGAELTDADLRDATLAQLRLVGVDLSGARVRRCDLADTQFVECVVDGVRFDQALGLEHEQVRALTEAGAAEQPAPLRTRLVGMLSGPEQPPVAEEELVPGVVLAGRDLRRTPLAGRDLSGANLRGCRLDGADLRGTSLAGAVLDGALLSRARLEGADLSRTRAEGAIFDDARLDRAVLDQLRAPRSSFVGARMRATSLVGAMLQDTDLSATNLEGADLRDANLSGAQLDQAVLLAARLDGCLLEGTDLEGALGLSSEQQEALADRGARLGGLRLRPAVEAVEAGLHRGAELATATGALARRLAAAIPRREVIDEASLVPGADLAGADLRRSSLAGRDLRGARLAGARLDGMDLRGTVLSGAVLDRANLSRVRLREARLDGASALGTRFDAADLLGADLSGLQAGGASFVDADLRGAKLEGAVLANGDLSAAILADLDLVDADLRGARFDQADLAGAILDRCQVEGADLGSALGLSLEHREALSQRGAHAGGLPSLGRFLTTSRAAQLLAAGLLAAVFGYAISELAEQETEIAVVVVEEGADAALSRYRGQLEQTEVPSEQVLVLYEMASLLEREGRLVEAEGVLVEAQEAAAGEDVVEVQVRLGSLRLLSGDREGAREAWSDALDQLGAPPELAARALVGLIDLERDELGDRAARAMEQAWRDGLTRNPGRIVDVSVLAAGQRVAAGDYEEALALLDPLHALSLAPDERASLLAALAELHVARGDLGQADALYAELLEVADAGLDQGRTLLAAASVAWKRQDVARALELLDRLERAGSHPRVEAQALLLRARVVREDDRETAVALYQRVMSEHSSDREALAAAQLGLAETLGPEAQREMADDLLSNGQGEQAGWMLLSAARRLRTTGDVDSARSLYDEVIGLDAGQEITRAAWRDLAELEIGLGDIDAGIKALRAIQAELEGMERVDVQARIADALLAAGRLQDAELAYQTLIDGYPEGSEAHIRGQLGLAVVAEARGEMEKARAGYAGIIANTSSPTIAGEAQAALAGNLLESGEPDLALAAWRDFLDTLPEGHEAAFDARLAVAEILRGRGEREAALVEYQLLLDVATTPALRSQVHVAVAELLEESGKHEEAGEVWRTLMEDPATPEDERDYVLVGLVRSELSQGNAQEALDLARSIELTDEGSRRLMLQLQVQALRALGRDEEADEYGLEVLAEEEDDELIEALEAANTLLNEWDFEGAIQAYEEILDTVEDRPTQAAIHTDLAQALAFSGDLEGARAGYGRVMRVYRDDPEAVFHAEMGLAWLSRLEGDPLSAIEGYERLVPPDPGSAVWRDEQLARALVEAGDRDAAEGLYKQMIRENAGDRQAGAAARAGLAELLLADEEFIAARALYEWVAENAPDPTQRSWASLHAAMLLVDEGRLDEAEEALEILLDHEDPEIALQAAIGLSAIELERGRPRRALDALDEVDPEELGGAWVATWTHQRSSSLVELGRPEDAEEAWQVVLDRWEDNDDVASQARLALGDLAMGQDDQQSATEWYELVLDTSPDRHYQARALLGLIQVGQTSACAQLIGDYPEQEDLLRVARVSCSDPR